MFKFQPGDQILVTAGKDKGKQGKISKVLPHQHRVQAEGVNLYTKHRRVTARHAAEKVTLSRPLPTANIALLCPHCHQPTRVTFQTDAQKKKTRLCAKCRQAISKPQPKKTTQPQKSPQPKKS